ncbi:NusA-like transcription termination signal-binding factor [Methanosarcinales archaeon]|mgnify:CR=1 FL=1|nr:MAG: NusA-like transcription termination signal-binding factor [Methanosarcinales archaeon]HHI30412.1 NusA-like transcription termination signal-binding factor [Candidatus Methanoperedenaceae archaeon]
MSELKLNTNGIRYIALFEQTTGASPIDCIINENQNRVTFIVKSEEMGAAIGRHGEHVGRLRTTINKQIEIIEYSENPQEFIKNLLQPVAVKKINIIEKNDKHIAYIEVAAREKGLAIGREGQKIEKVKSIVKRHHDIDNVIIQ